MIDNQSSSPNHRLYVSTELADLLEHILAGEDVQELDDSARVTFHPLA